MSELNSIENISIGKIIAAIKESIKGIIIFVISVAIITAVVNYFVLKPVYECKTVLNINIPSTVLTQYGEYKFPSVDPLDYSYMFENIGIAQDTIEDLDIDMEAQALIDNLSIKITGETKNSVSATRSITLTFKSNFKEKSDIILNKYSENLLEALLIKFKEDSINESYMQINTGIEFNRNELLSKEKILEDTTISIFETDEFVTLKYIMTADSELFLKYIKDNSIDLENVDDEVLFTEIINPAYEKLLTTKTDVLKEIAYFNGEILKLQSQQKRLESENDAIQIYNESKDSSNLDDDYMNVMKNRIKIIHQADEPESPVSPEKVKNIMAISFLSIVISFFVVLLKYFIKI